MGLKAMVRPDREKLIGEIEVNETYIGKESDEKEDGSGKTGRGCAEKIIVVFAFECLDK